MRVEIFEKRVCQGLMPQASAASMGKHGDFKELLRGGEGANVL
jgi:hypothetical protein